MPARNSSIAAEPAFDPVAQTDQTKTEVMRLIGEASPDPARIATSRASSASGPVGQEQRQLPVSTASSPAHQVSEVG